MMTRSDQKYYAAERRREAQRKYTRKFLDNRKKAAEKWKKDHPEGITEENLKKFQAFMRQADKTFRTNNP